MKRSQLLNVFSIPVLLIAVGIGGFITGPASADNEKSGAISNSKNPGYRAPSVSKPDRISGYRPSSPGDYRKINNVERDWRQHERSRGIGAGQRSGWQAGYAVGYHHSARRSAGGIGFSRESLPYQRGFRSGYEVGFERGFHAGKAAYAREHHRASPFRSGFQFRIGF